MSKYSKNYIKAGGKEDFSGYYVAKYDNAQFDAGLIKNVLFSAHNLSTDSVFNEFNVILCRNVMIYFNHTLSERVFQLFSDSLGHFGILALGKGESLHGACIESSFEQIIRGQKIYKKMK